MLIPYFHIDSFTKKVFAGNPAGVCVLESWLDDATLLGIAAENGLAETAFIVGGNGVYGIRWFTPDIEMDLCGHATLAAAHVVANYLDNVKEIKFKSATDELNVQIEDGLITMMFPRREPVTAVPPQRLLDSLNIRPKEVLKSRDFIFVYDKEDDVRNIQIDPIIFNQINLDPGGLCVTAPGLTVDFVSRFFTPQATILEDPVTGSAHCSLIPYWGRELKKNVMTAKQISKRQGDLLCRNDENRVIISGNAVTYKTGHILLSQET